MNKKYLIILFAFLGAGLFSCQERENRDSKEVEIIPEEAVSENNTPMERSRIIASLRENEDLSTFSRNLEQSGLSEEFEGKEGRFTFFAPSNAAYDRIPAKEINPDGSPLTGESEKDLMRYYIVEGELTVDYLREKIRASENGRYQFTTALGEKLWATEEGERIVLIDVLGNKAAIQTSKMDDYYGVYHVIDNVLQAREGNKQNEE